MVPKATGRQSRRVPRSGSSSGPSWMRGEPEAQRGGNASLRSHIPVQASCHQATVTCQFASMNRLIHRSIIRVLWVQWSLKQGSGSVCRGCHPSPQTPQKASDRANTLWPLGAVLKTQRWMAGPRKAVLGRVKGDGQLGRKKVWSVWESGGVAQGPAPGPLLPPTGPPQSHTASLPSLPSPLRWGGCSPVSGTGNPFQRSLGEGTGVPRRWEDRRALQQESSVETQPQVQGVFWYQACRVRD